MFEMSLSEIGVPSLSAQLINLAIGVALALVLRWHFRTFGSTLSSRDEFAQVFPFIPVTTVLVTTVTQFVDLSSSSDPTTLTADLQRAFPQIGVSFIGQTKMPSI